NRLARLAAVRLLIRQKQGPRELLRERAAALDGPTRTHVAEDGASQPDRIDTEMLVEAMILAGDERVLQVRGNVGERHVLAVLVHPEPGPPVGGEEPGVADAAPQFVDGPCLPQRPGERDRGQ